MNTIFKRFLSLAILVAMLTTVLVPQALADDTSELSVNEPILCTGPSAALQIPEPIELPYGPTEDEYAVSTFSSSVTDEVELLLSMEQLVREAILNGETKIDLTPYKIYPSDINLYRLSYLSPYISNGISISCYYYSGSYYSSLVIETNMTESEAANHIAKVDKKINEVSVMLNKGRSDLEKALLLHDHLAYIGEYDYDNYLADTVPVDSYRSAGILLNGIGVCQSYAYAFMYFMSLEGIDCRVINSEDMNHAWNIINIDGEYYHVDVTWDDPVYDRPGRVTHNHFLLSDDAIGICRTSSTEYHYGWDSEGIVCDSTMYDDTDYDDILSSIITVGNYTYYIENNYICRHDNSTGNDDELVSLGKWRVWGSLTRYWKGTFSGLYLYENELYYNTSTQIRKLNIDTLKDSLVYTPDTSDGYIYGSAVIDGVFKYAICSTPNDEATVYTLNFSDISTWKEVSLDISLVSIEEGDTFKLTTYGITSGLSWSTDNEFVASVSADGTVTAEGVGVTVITVTAENGTSANCVVTVTEKTAPSHLFGNWTVTLSPTCTEEGKEIRSCLFCGYSESREVPSLGHDIAIHEPQAPTCTEIGWEEYETCSRCDYSTYTEIPANGHDYTVTVTAPTCTAKGYTSHVCTCGDSFTDSYVDEIEHSFGEWATVKEPTESDPGLRERKCDNCDATESAKIPELGHTHSYASTVVSPTCTEDGYTLYECRCGDTYKDSIVTTTGHSLGDATITSAPTCTDNGEECRYCKNCTYYEVSVIEKLGHNVTVYHEVAPTCTQNGSTSYEACSRCDYSTPSEIITSLGHNYSSEWTVDIEATEDSEGEKSHHCIRCDSRVNVTVIPKTVNSSEIFSDIPANEWFKKSVDFVVSNGLMNGIGGDTFDPNGTMTRAMVVTVLYRMENSPEVTSSVPFNDLKESWYEAAVAWAYKNNIVNGTGPNTFDPYGEITREQLATILHRYSEYKKYEVSLNEDIDMNFPDLNKTNSWAEAAIAWAVSEGLITGSNEGGIILLKPDGDATRAQVATILTRFCNKH